MPWIAPLFGFFQWLVLRKYSRRLGWWVLVSAYTWITTYFIIILFEVGAKILEAVPKGELLVIGVSVNIQVLWTSILVALLGSSVIGVCQWLVMRNHIQCAGWWILASSMGGVGRGFVSVVLQPVVDPIIADIAGSLAYSAVTGMALVWLLQNRIKRRLEREMYLI
ncbi:hypothetical protein GNF10_27285 [Nostoc sp. UCD121]|uniref:hypothetical protein n=1 Tax=unclassified Nostoc TaxID=2593658 RepID=UPI0016290868|nr:MULTISPECIES: hypothetical protein [unclassified Nostoc]MBC1224365.1 hypothetical protein [Nostoc sp. UCD120]MBC1279561.1 hypothetical protein [Nostoc sp. UCD121]MBC1296460.1 hypothetical protein [Nostoc sp. UCD122]